MSSPQEEPVTDAAEPALPPLANRIRVLVLQHPQEQREDLASGGLLQRSLSQTRRRVGLSWPSLKAAWGGEDPVRPESWAVLYLGARGETPAGTAPLLLVLDRKGNRVADQAAARRLIGGIVLLDGTWAQAKTLWWRNPWLLKLARVQLNPSRPSLYGPLRREPRPGALSTLEAAALALAELEASPALQEALLERFQSFLSRQRPAEPAPASRRRPWRRNRRLRSRGDG